LSSTQSTRQQRGIHTLPLLLHCFLPLTTHCTRRADGAPCVARGCSSGVGAGFLFVTLVLLSQTDYNKWDKIVASLSDDEYDANSGPAGSLSTVPLDLAEKEQPVGVGASLSGALLCCGSTVLCNMPR